MENCYNKITFYSDHEPLRNIRSKKDPRGKIGRWIMELENLDYTIKYFQGTENIEADYLSKIPGSDKPGETPVVYNATVDDMLSKIIFKAQNEDSVISEVAVNLKDQKPIRTGPFKKYSNLQLSEAGLVCKGSRIIVPASLRELVIKEYHGQNHPGVDNTTIGITARFYFKITKRLRNYSKWYQWTLGVCPCQRMEMSVSF